MLKISYRDYIINAEVLNRISKEAELPHTIQEGELKYFGHVYRQPGKYPLIHNVLNGEIEGKWKPGRTRMSRIVDLRK